MNETSPPNELTDEIVFIPEKIALLFNLIHYGSKSTQMSSSDIAMLYDSYKSALTQGFVEYDETRRAWTFPLNEILSFRGRDMVAAISVTSQKQEKPYEIIYIGESILRNSIN